MRTPDEQRRYQAKYQFLQKHVFHDLSDQNDGFDSPAIAHFTAEEFAVVLERVRTLGLGIHGIEVFRNEEFYDVTVPDEEKVDPRDPAWYINAFARLKAKSDGLLFSATFDVPDELLDRDATT